ncbi:hypothetical protein [Mycobacterium phage HC]|uniref:Uncharacterized protein n=2 Tax=Brujitavirus TaxID=2169611 RepID=A0A2Z5XVN4_9CAUD|nr:hypothetical protein CM06_gp38 [Mycobacterium phage Babsiella]YP_010088216.1 hypothetical protein KNT11_gp36 [Mycobacterium phage HC]WRQ08786.1 hypothetical protein JDBV09_00305 [Mycobacterium phage mika]WRQ08972.1 hypothetical protein JDBV03_01810 [Mycobacterium phage ridax]AER48415.1 hypothetical protein BABSIELLA_38 [Mycobacterium phage Babsiella]BBC53910.1 hypothetical protein [Mycobacterium phage HC]
MTGMLVAILLMQVLSLLVQLAHLSAAQRLLDLLVQLAHLSVTQRLLDLAQFGRRS